MAEPRGNSDQNKSKTDFLNRIQKVRSEIRNKFRNIRKVIDNQELKCLAKVEEMQSDILESYARACTSLKEITQVREQVIAGLKSNSTNDLLRKNLEMYDREIKTVKKRSKIDSIFEIYWKIDHLDLSTEICEVVSYLENAPPEIPPVLMTGGQRLRKPPRRIQTLSRPSYMTLLPQETFYNDLPHHQMFEPDILADNLIQPIYSSRTPTPPNSQHDASSLDRWGYSILFPPRALSYNDSTRSTPSPPEFM